MRQAHERSNVVMRRDGRVNSVVNNHVNAYTHTYRPVFYTHYNRCTGYYGRYGNSYRPWYRHGFYGGYYWRLRPVYDIHLHFWNPIIFWLYADQWDDYYYSKWYGSDWWSYPNLRQHWSRPGVFYPTEAMRDLALGVSQMTPNEQGNFRTGLIDLSNRIEATLTARLGYSIVLQRNDVVVTHYQIVEGAVVLDGFISAEAQQFAFKAYLDLNDPAMNSLFVPGPGEGEPTDGQIRELRIMNERIEQLGGTNEFPPEAALQ